MSTLYRVAKRAMSYAPAGVLRVRPFGVYAIDLTAGPVIGGALSSKAPSSKANDALGVGAQCNVRWITSPAAARVLSDLADPRTIEATDGAALRAAVAYRDGAPIACACAWVATGAFEEPDLGIRFTLKPDEAWLFAAVVAPAHRRQGVYSRLLEFITSELRHSGARRLLLGVAAGNAPSLRAHSSHGAKKIGSVFALKSFGLSACVTTGAVRRISASPVYWRRSVELVVR